MRQAGHSKNLRLRQHWVRPLPRPLLGEVKEVDRPLKEQHQAFTHTQHLPSLHNQSGGSEEVTRYSPGHSAIPRDTHVLKHSWGHTSYPKVRQGPFRNLYTFRVEISTQEYPRAMAVTPGEVPLTAASPGSYYHPGSTVPFWWPHLPPQRRSSIGVWSGQHHTLPQREGGKAFLPPPPQEISIPDLTN